MGMTSEERQRLDSEWIGTVALRETFTIAQEQAPTYLETLAYGEALYPDLFDPETSLLRQNQESIEARDYRELAKVQSIIKQRDITALEIVEREIEEVDSYLNLIGKQGFPSLKKKRRKLLKVRDELSYVIHVENQIIDRDVNKAKRKLPVSGEGKDYKEFRLNDNRALRIRLLHPNKPEHITGADLIYELYSTDGEFAYVTAVQYKLWDEGDVLYMDDRITSQIEKMRKNFCESGLCETPIFSDYASSRIASFCAGFLRLTSRLQKVDSNLLSKGDYIPICKLENFYQKTRTGGNKLSAGDIQEFIDGRTKPISHGIFEEMVKRNMLGSKAIPINYLESLYEKFSILEPNQKIIIHAQDFI